MLVSSGRARIAAAAGDTATADRLWLGAAVIDSPLALERARILVAYGDWLRTSGRSADARRPYAEGLALAEGAGAVQWVARAEAGLRAAGGRRVHRAMPPGELTAQERRVAALAAEGLTTVEIAARLFLSPRTIETHLGNVYAKLGVTSKRSLRGRAFGSPT